MTFSLRLPGRRAALVAALATGMAAAAPAQAQDARPGWYASLTGAWVLTRDSDLSYTAGGLTVSSTLELKSGFGVMAAVGYGSTDGFRGEVELGWRSADWTKLKGGSITGTLDDNDVDVSVSGSLPIKGSISTLSLMANGYFGFEVWKLRPYIGGGFGMARHEGKFDAQSYTIDGTEYTFSSASEDDYVFAYQAMAGVAYPLSDRMAIKAGYRYFATSDAEFDVKASYGTHNFEAGVLFRF